MTPTQKNSVLPSLTEIEAALKLVRRFLPETPSYCWPLLCGSSGAEVWMKHENHLPVGAFKVRGGLVYLDALLKKEPKVAGVIAASTGNHGQSVAFAARQHGVRAIVVTPHGNNPEKNAAMRALGAEVIGYGSEFQEALLHSKFLAEREGLHPLPSFHPLLVTGVATFALEWFRAVPHMDVIFIPIGLGSGACGVIAAREALGLSTKVIGVVSEQSPAYAVSFRQGRLTTRSTNTLVAEGVACSTPDPLAFQWIQKYVEDVVTVTDEEALIAMREIFEGTHNVAEGAGALAYAAFRKQRKQWQGKRVGCVLSGGNANLELMSQALATKQGL